MVVLGFNDEVVGGFGEEVILIVEEDVTGFVVVLLAKEEVLGLVDDDGNGRLPCHSTQYSFPVTRAKQSTPGL